MRMNFPSLSSAACAALLPAWVVGCSSAATPSDGSTTGGSPAAFTPSEMSSSGGAASGSGGSVGAGATSGVPASGGVPAFVGPAKILCVGDSITAGEDSWMHPLERRLNDENCSVEFIGYDESPYDGAYGAPEGLSSKRIAAGGFSTRGILNWIESKDRDLGGVPDVWIQYLGANNEWGGFIDGTYNPDVRDDPEGAYVADTKALIEIVREKNPRAYFVLVKIQDDLLPGIDEAIDQLVDDENTEASPVVAIGGASGVSTTDGLHPDAEGAETLASPVADHLATLLDGRGLCGN